MRVPAEPPAELCAECGTDHDGYPVSTVGGELRCLRAQSVRAGVQPIVDLVDAWLGELDDARDRFLRAEGLIP